MEITLFAFLSLLLLERYAARAHPLSIGLLCGLMVWTRPEGLVLAAAVALGELLSWAAARAPLPRAGERGSRTPRRRVLLLAAGLSTLFAVYVLLNLSISGQPFPSTLYAKQAEYRALLERPVWVRLWVVARRPLVGAQALLLPGFAWQCYLALRQALRSFRSLPAGAGPDGGGLPALAAVLPIAWWAAYHGLYALRLPVDYQHGRYLIPTLPTLLTYGITGTLRWLGQASTGEGGQRPLARIWRRALAGALAVLCLAFLVLGAQAYVKDRCIIHHEMVRVALWVRENTPPDSLIAAHDIGALGYWAQRPVLDLAGLINPEVIPVMRDEERLLDYILDQGAGYLVTFPSWYPALVQDDRLVRVYPAQDQPAPPVQVEPMTVYQIAR
jgi:hypothetical protein